MFENGSARTYSWLARTQACGALVLLLSCAEGPTGEPRADACLDECPQESPKLDFSGGKVSFEAHVRVLDKSGNPVDKARVEVGERSAVTDDSGRATVKNVDARSTATLKVSGDKAAPAFTSTDAWKSGQTTQNVTLQPLSLKTSVDLEEPVIVQKDFGRLSLEENSIAAPDGQRPKKANLEVADLLGESKQGHDQAHDFKAVYKNGSPSLLKNIDAMGYVRLTSESGGELNLAPTKTALLELKLPDDSDAEPGDKLALWSLDEKSLSLHEESECVVEEQQLGGQKSARVCKGHVSHFSVWAVASADPVGDALRCLDVQAGAAEEACFDVEIERVFLLACDEAGERCAEASYRSAYFGPGAGSAPAYCGVLDQSPSYRVAVLYDADASACGAGLRGKGGRHIKLSEPLTPDAAGGAELLRAFRDDPRDTCASACTQLTLHIEAADLSALTLTDRDYDGHYASSGGEDTVFPGRRADCDDADPDTYPGAPELFCDDVDRNCDGEQPPAAHTPAALGDDARWNATCYLCSELETAAEVPGNLLDEDCDGQADDRDADGFSEPEDCDDASPDAAPGLSELPGNALDEDCDGVALDWDGDGMPSPAHLYLAEAAALAPALFVDCDDFDAATYPGAPGAQNACELMAGDDGCPSFLWAGSSIQTQCDEALDNGQGTGQGVCVFGSWAEGGPLSLEPGQIWGPCDGPGPLPDCAPDAQCGGPLPYSSEFTEYLEHTYTGGAPLSFLGMCFPKCEL
jgi:hypothetical protein